MTSVLFSSHTVLPGKLKYASLHVLLSRLSETLVCSTRHGCAHQPPRWPSELCRQAGFHHRQCTPAPMMCRIFHDNMFRDTLTSQMSRGSKYRSCTTTRTAQIRAPNALARRSPSSSTRLCTDYPVTTVNTKPPASLPIFFNHLLGSR